MTFQELLTYTRGPSWLTPKRLVALDPGETCGLAFFEWGELIDTEQIKLYFKSGDRGWDSLVDRIEQIVPTVVVYEDYKIYPGKLKAHTFSGVPTLKLIGAIEFLCNYNKYQAVPQMASTAKGFCTDDKLKEWGFYKRGRPHAMDALRHGLHALLFNKEL